VALEVFASGPGLDAPTHLTETTKATKDDERNVPEIRIGYSQRGNHAKNYCRARIEVTYQEIREQANEGSAADDARRNSPPGVTCVRGALKVPREKARLLVCRKPENEITSLPIQSSTRKVENE